MALDEKTIAFIGAGHITSILLDNLVKAGNLRAHRLFASDPDKDKLQQLHDNYGIVTTEDNLEAVEKGEFIFINVRPQVVRIVIDELSRKRIPKNRLIVTLAAGIPINAYEGLGHNIPVVRALPNPPSQIGMGIAALAFNPYVSETQRNDVIELFSCLGEYVILEEGKINAVTALSSPVTTHLLFQAIIDTAVRLGIDRETSTKIAYHTINGSMELWNTRQVSPYNLISEASTPGGISTEITFTLEKKAFKAIIAEALEVGYMRAAEFST